MAQIKLTPGKKADGSPGYKPSIVIDDKTEISVSDEFMDKEDALKLGMWKTFQQLSKDDKDFGHGVVLIDFTKRYLDFKNPGK